MAQKKHPAAVAYSSSFLDSFRESIDITKYERNFFFDTEERWQ